MIRIEDLEFRYPGGEFRLSIPELTVEASIIRPYVDLAYW